MTRLMRLQAWRRIGAILTAALGLACVCGLPALAKAPTAPERPRIEMSVRASQAADMFSELTIDSPALAARIARAERLPAERTDCYTDLEVAVQDAQGRNKQYRLERKGNLWDEAAQQMLRLSPDASQRLLAYAETLRRRHYGKLMDWNEARNVVTRKSMFTIVDLESGLSFRVQRRAGSDHADVQPISREDSKVMKQIYGGKWSWQRRAIVVSKDGARIAASMNGMPHGGDGIPDNGFNGHFCVHFLGSSSHRSDTPDPAHQLMVHKASGSLRSYFDSASPQVLAASFVEALNQKDGEMLRLIWSDASADRIAAMDRLIGRLESIYVKRTRTAERDDVQDDKLSAAVALPLLVRLQDRGTLHCELRFEFARSSPHLPWRIAEVASDHSSLIP
ncbi:hypothetical protein B0G52_105299 [Cohnella sp. SGD-V74]|uniref:hypothetical protein n=1 Tax=unclassified Cohnella TaxID=2636738 RepID=UPI000D48EEED|nr:MULTISPECIES: hypothetical protein [unclassified Cohnella]PRX72745.1 hypothetical protein B0G52_105299 [Cohnella sp. SGD-V74]